EWHHTCRAEQFAVTADSLGERMRLSSAVGLATGVARPLDAQSAGRWDVARKRQRVSQRVGHLRELVRSQQTAVGEPGQRRAQAGRDRDAWTQAAVDDRSRV